MGRLRRAAGDAQRVVPLMVLQVPNTPDPNDIGRALDTILQQWPDLPRDFRRPRLRRTQHPDLRQSYGALHLAGAGAG